MWEGGGRLGVDMLRRHGGGYDLTTDNEDQWQALKQNMGAIHKWSMFYTTIFECNLKKKGRKIFEWSNLHTNGIEVGCRGFQI